MSRRLRVGFGVVALVIIGLISAVAIFLYTVDYGRYKGLVEGAITDATGRRIEINGELAIAMALSPEFTVSDVSLANAPWGSQPQMAHIGQLRVRLRLLPLLRRDVEITQLKLIDTDLLLETDASGQVNWLFGRQADSRKGVGIRSVVVEHLEIERLSVTLRSGETGAPASHYELNRLELIRSPASDLLAVELKGSSNGQTVTLSGQTGGLEALFAGVRFPIDLSGEVAGATVKLQGELANALTLEGLDLTIEASGTDLAMLGKGIGTKVPETGSFDIAAKLQASRDVLAVGDVRGSVSHKSIQLELKGGIGDLKMLKDIQLELKGSGKDLAELSSIVGETLPQTGAFEVSGKLAGNAKTLTLNEIQGAIRQQSIKLSLAGGIDDLIAFEGVDLNLHGSGNNLSELSSIVGETLPQTGPFEVSGKLAGNAKALTLSEARGTISHQSIKLTLAGMIDELMTLKGIHLDAKGSGENIGELRSMLGEKLPSTGPFTASARLTGSAQALTVRNLNAEIRQGNSQLLASGKIGDVLKLTGIDLELEGSGKNLGELGPLFDKQLPYLGPFAIKGQLIGSDKLLELNSFSATADQSDFKGWAKMDLGKRPKLTLRLESGLVDFTRIIEQVKGEKPVETGKAGGFRQKTMFSDKPLPFDLLDAVDADIEFNARNLKARDATLESGQLALRLEAGDLRVDKLEATYRGTKVSATLNLAAGTPSNVAVRLLVQGLDLGRLLKEIHVSQEVEGLVDLAVDLTSQGNSLHRLMANLDGITGAVIGKGYVPRFLDLLAQGLSRRVISIWGHHKKSGQLNCGVIQFTNKAGIATSDVFLFDTQLAILKGKGEINLATEQLDFILSPKPKDSSLFSLATKLRVDGSILDPRVRPEWSSMETKAVKALSALAVGPAGLLVPFMRAGARKQHPCDIKELKSRMQSIYQ